MRPVAEASEREAKLQEYERGFRRAGLPLFSEDFSAGTDVFNRAAPLLALVFIAQMFGAIQLDWTWWQNTLAVLGGLAVLLVAFGLLNRARGRPFTAVPERLGKTELAGFVLIPALLPLIFGVDDEGALATVGREPPAPWPHLRGRRPRPDRDPPLGPDAAGGPGSLGAGLDRQRRPAAGDLRPALVHHRGALAHLLVDDDGHLLHRHRALRLARHGLPRRPHPARGETPRGRGRRGKPAAAAAAS